MPPIYASFVRPVSSADTEGFPCRISMILSGRNYDSLQATPRHSRSASWPTAISHGPPVALVPLYKHALDKVLLVLDDYKPRSSNVFALQIKGINLFSAFDRETVDQLRTILDDRSPRDVQPKPRVGTQ